MKAIARVLNSPTEVYWFDRSFSIGRKDDNDVSIKSPCVSRKHLTIFPHNGEWFARDEESLNGTHLEGKGLLPPGKPVKLLDGDVVNVGNVAIEFSFVG